MRLIHAKLRYLEKSIISLCNVVEIEVQIFGYLLETGNLQEKFVCPGVLFLGFECQRMPRHLPGQDCVEYQGECSLPVGC